MNGKLLMFKLRIINDQVSMDFEKTLKAIKEYGLEYLRSTCDMGEKYRRLNR